MKKLILHFCALGILAAFTSCSVEKNDPVNEDLNLKAFEGSSVLASERLKAEKLHVFKGPQVQYGEGKIRSFISLDDDDFPVEIGFIMTKEVFDNVEILPEFDIATVFPLHQKAKEVTPFEHLALKWSEGHPPAFFDPHFDFYFYMISNEERLSIPEYTPETEDFFTLYPPEGYMPEDYGTPPGQGGVYPYIGKHWLPLNLPAYLPFTSIMVLGTFNGEYIFTEPMATLDVLISDPDISAEFSQPEFFHESNNYPTRYNIYEDSKTGDVYVTLSDFVAR
ncbi:MAG: hypothetical protein R3259_03735 [Salinimicrobium sediminis]|nr:hypothetical protein [Salinimicrobium sediminis]